MLITKTLLLSCLLWGSGTLAATIPENVDLKEGPPGPTDAPGAPKRLRRINPEIRPSELNKHLHPNAKYTAQGIDCADGEQIVVEGQVIGCFFINEEEAIDQAVKAVAAAKNIKEAYVDEPAVSEDVSPPTPLANRLTKRGDWATNGYHCFGSGVYSYIQALRSTAYTPCASIDSFGGHYVAGASWTITQLGSFQNPVNIYAAGDSSIQLRHDFYFQPMYSKDTWVHSTITGQCTTYVDMLFGFSGWSPYCIGGSGYDSRGGWMERHDVTWPYRSYRIGVDPNRFSGGNN
ncbi:hypothetical protein TWF506_008203 [Arthrobotrys conoides]|uniref:Uncharacterized protein n=1 Tax=Arthrobotrys conoides TaxID=74498 RepID=A0AAN8RTP8_9PEZI